MFKNWVAKTANFIGQRPILPFAILACALGGFVILLALRPQAHPSSNRERIWTVRAQEVVPHNMQIRIVSFGELLPRREIELRALVAGEVVATSTELKEGARVTKGHMLLQIDPFQYETRLVEARAAVEGGDSVFSHRVIHFGEKLGDKVRVRSPKKLKILIEVP